MKKKTRLTATVLSLLLGSVIAGMQIARFGKANPLPSIDPKITIENPQNTTYHMDTIILNFTAASNWGVYSVFYSLDGQEMIPVENMTIILQEDVNIGKNPRVVRTTLKGSCVLSNLSKGRHNVTVYQIYQFETYEKHETGDILTSATTEFLIETFSITGLLSMTLGAVVSMVLIGMGLLAYFKKRNR